MKDDAFTFSSSDVLRLTPNALRAMNTERLRAVASKLVEIQREDRKENALLYYRPVSKDASRVHTTPARVIGVGGGNGSSKTETCLVEAVIQATGIVPEALRETYPRERLRGPINVRVVCESLTTVLHPIILPKLQWFKWVGPDTPGGDKGHFGWIPRQSLVHGSWDRSWSEKLRTLRVLYRNPDRWDEIQGESLFQFMSIDQDPSDFASGDFHLVLHDEPPPHAIWRENQARTMRVAGRMLVAMTWPDDPSIPVDWIFDEVYEPGCDPKNTNIEWINLYTTDNAHLNQEAIALQMKAWSPETVQVRIYGQPIRFSNRVHPEFTDQTQWWCFECKTNVVVAGESDRTCATCNGRLVAPYNHVQPFEVEPNWPTVFLLDPHPRKPHMGMWVQVSPNDDLRQVGEITWDGPLLDFATEVFSREERESMKLVKRMIDPNMGRSPSGARRGVCWQDEFDAVGLRCDLADDSDVGRKRMNEYLRPDPDTRQPRIAIRQGFCPQTVHQIKRYVWDEWRRSGDKDQKQTPKDKNDDFPTLWKYLLNEEPTFRGLMLATRYHRQRSTRRTPPTRTVRAAAPSWYQPNR